MPIAYNESYRVQMILKGRVARGNFYYNLQNNDVAKKYNAGCSGMSNVRKLFSATCNNLQRRSPVKQIITFKIAVQAGEDTSAVFAAHNAAFHREISCNIREPLQHKAIVFATAMQCNAALRCVALHCKDNLPSVTWCNPL